MKFPMELQYGDFGRADPEVEKRTEQGNYNVKIMIWISRDTTAEVCIIAVNYVQGLNKHSNKQSIRNRIACIPFISFASAEVWSSEVRNKIRKK